VQGATFVSYKPERGEWRFDVEHFSRYGLVDADTDDEQPQADKANSAEDKLTEDEGSIAMLEGEHAAGVDVEVHMPLAQLVALLPW
jgi:Nucleoporin autopeptidase